MKMTKTRTELFAEFIELYGREPPGALNNEDIRSIIVQTNDYLDSEKILVWQPPKNKERVRTGTANTIFTYDHHCHLAEQTGIVFPNYVGDGEVLDCTLRLVTYTKRFNPLK